jgi:hypothetical protein
MTPCINVAKKAKVPYEVHEYAHNPSIESYGSEAAKKMGVPEKRVFKTLIVRLGTNDLGACPRMPFLPNSSEFSENNARNIKHMAVLIF